MIVVGRRRRNVLVAERELRRNHHAFVALQRHRPVAAERVADLDRPVARHRYGLPPVVRERDHPDWPLMLAGDDQVVAGPDTPDAHAAIVRRRRDTPRVWVEHGCRDHAVVSGELVLERARLDFPDPTVVVRAT